MLGLRICGTAGAKGLGEVKARIERGVRLFVTCGCVVLVVLCKGQKTSGRQLGASKGGRSAARGALRRIGLFCVVPVSDLWGSQFVGVRKYLWG